MNSIRRKLTVMLTGAISVVILLAAWATYVAAREETGKLLDYQLEQIALALRDQDFHGPTETIAGDRSLDFVIRIWDRDGLSIYYSRPHRVLPEIARLGFASEQTSEGEWRVYALQYRGETIAVAQPLAVRARIAARAALHTLLPFIVTLPLLALLIGFVVRRELRPLVTLANSIGRRSPQALAAVEEIGMPDEVRPLLHALNDLLGRLHRALQGQRDFIADAAHELRTPLAALQLQADLVERAADEKARAAALATLRQGLARCSYAVAQLLTLARNEPGGGERRRESIVPLDIVHRVVADRAVLADARNIDLGVAVGDPGLRVEGDAEALQTLLANVIDNALHHTPAGGRIDVSCLAGDRDRVLLQVADSGPGIPVAERERVFDRFYRRQQDSSGSGLGLTIVRNIAQAHSGSVELDDAAEGGLLVTVSLPAGAGCSSEDAPCLPVT
jgi:two-component system, OmpR family, sensor kinase